MYAATAPLVSAEGDYRWLLDPGYPQTASLKLVGDRHRLERDERLVLFRGVSAAAASASRRALVSDTARGRTLLVDGYNQAFAVMHYLAGRPVFLSSDGLLRDAGASHGRISDRALFSRSLAILAGAIAAACPSDVTACFDSPVPFSADHAREFERELRAAGLEATCLAVRSADAALIAALETAAPGTSVASADSVIADALIVRASAAGGRPVVFDAARFAIEREFGQRTWLDFGAVLDRPDPPPPCP